MELTYLYKGLKLAPVAVERIIALVPADKYDVKTDPERFSLREAISHLADWEEIHLFRLRSGVENPGATVQGHDEGQFAIDRGYAGWDPDEQAKRFIVGREPIVHFLHTLTDEDWDKILVHSERGPMTVLQYATSIVGHDVYHIEHFTQYLA